MTENGNALDGSLKKKFDEHLEFLTRDIQELEKIATETGRQIDRRNFVRGAFAYIEGANYNIKSLILYSSPKKLTPEQTLLLREEAYDLKDNGEIKRTALKLQTLPNIKFTFKIFSSIFDIDNPLDTSSQGWQRLVKALKIRHRLVHPKSASDGVVSEEDMATVKAAYQYFGISMAKAFILAILNATKELKEMESNATDLTGKIDEAFKSEHGF